MCREVHFFLLIVFLVGLTASKCPESRKSHPTNCTMFYSCINLPGDRYVWAPSKCSEGLVFESYLRMCVLPSETWTCDSLSQPIAIRKKHEAELMKSYLDYNSDPFNLSEMVDSSDLLDSTSNEEIIQETTPYSSNEELVSNLAAANENRDVITRKTANSIYDEPSEKENFSQFGNKTLLISSVTWLDRIIDNLLIHQKMKILLNDTLLVNSEIETTYPIKNSVNKKDALFNHFVTNDIIKNNIENKYEDLNEESEILKDATKYKKFETTTSKIEIQLTSISNQSENNLGETQYLTLEKKEFLKDQLNLESGKIIPCSSGIRFPNKTDCTKYYICEPRTASIKEFSCPFFTAFDEKARICNTRKYSSCEKIKNKKVESSSDLDEITRANTIILKKSVCETVGKNADPISPSHYYVCYTNNGKNSNIQSVRMRCPNNLLFCTEKKICASKQFCTKRYSK